MKIEKRYDLFRDFNFSILNDPEYGEDSVREEIVYPIIKSLGYGSSSNYRIVRSRKLLHPFVSIGSQQKKINIIPDYVMEIDGKPAWILEAKAPGQEILQTKHVEQAYSYAIHSEIRALYYALCNGKKFLLYHVSEYKPILYFDIERLPFYWDQLIDLLAPENLHKNSNCAFSKDFGLHLKRLGFSKNLIFYDIPIDFIAKIQNELYTFSSSTKIDGNSYCASFDFDNIILMQLHGVIPDDVIEYLKKDTNGAVQKVEFADALFYANLECDVSDQLVENNKEIFMPLKVTKIIR